MKELSDSIDICELEYMYGNKRCKMIFMTSKFTLNLCLKQESTLLGDGTFSTTPPMYNQLYIFHLLVSKQAYPLFFILTIHRTKNVYRAIFRKMKDLGISIRLFMCDYENAVRKAFGEIYGTSILKGCWFHFCQSLIRNVKSLRLGNEYKSNVEINEIVRLYFSLSFVPIDQIEDYQIEIRKRIEKISDLFLKEKMLSFDSYFSRTWMDKIYKKSDWNQLVDIQLRSNNWSESFNSLFSKRFCKPHPNIYQLVFVIDEVDKYYKFIWNDNMINISNDENEKIDEFTNEIRATVMLRDTKYNGEKMKYLEKMSKIEFHLILKMEKNFLLENKINPNRVQQINKMLDSDIEFSFYQQRIIKQRKVRWKG